MTTATIRIENVMGIKRREEHFAQTKSGAIAQSKTRAKEHSLTDTDIKKEAWQGHLKNLQRYVCELLLQNQELRLALIAVNGPERGHGDPTNS